MMYNRLWREVIIVVYMISYDLKAPGRNYDDLYKEIKSFGDYVKCLESQWFVDTNKNESEIFVKLQTKIDASDSLFVLRLIKGYRGVINKPAVDWLVAHAVQIFT